MTWKADWLRRMIRKAAESRNCNAVGRLVKQYRDCIRKIKGE